MSSWGYIGIGLFCGVVAGILFAVAGPSATDLALADLSGKTAGSNGFLEFLGWVCAAASSVLTLIGVIAAGVRLGMDEAR